MQVEKVESDRGIRALDRMLASIEHVLLEEVEGNLLLLKSTPEWFNTLADLGLGRSVMAWLPFLDSFLVDARQFWQQATKDEHIQSDLWTQQDIHGNEVHLLAYALFISGRRLLLVHPDEELYQEQESYQTFVHKTILGWRALKRSKADCGDVFSMSIQLAAEESNLLNSDGRYK